MTPVKKRIRLDQPVVYRIMLQGRLGERWETLGENAAIEYGTIADGTTVSYLTFTAADQSAFFGILNQIRDLDVPLLSLEIID